MSEQNTLSPVGGEILVYQTESGRVKLDVRLEDETVWLTQQMMAELFQTSKQNISQHVQAIYAERELMPEATVKKYLTVRREHKEARAEADYVKQLEEAARRLPARKKRGAE